MRSCRIAVPGGSTSRRGGPVFAYMFLHVRTCKNMYGGAALPAGRRDTPERAGVGSRRWPSKAARGPPRLRISAISNHRGQPASAPLGPDAPAPVSGVKGRPGRSARRSGTRRGRSKAARAPRGLPARAAGGAVRLGVRVSSGQVPGALPQTLPRAGVSCAGPTGAPRRSRRCWVRSPPWSGQKASGSRQVEAAQDGGQDRRVGHVAWVLQHQPLGGRQCGGQGVGRRREERVERAGGHQDGLGD